MKDAEDEAFDELAKRQGHWGGGYQAKRQMAADKLQEPVAFPCCGYTDANAIRWNQFNGVVQCHMCGQVYTVAQPAQEPVTMRMPKVGDKVICLEDESLGTIVSLTAGGSPDIKFDDGSHGTYLLREFAELFCYASTPQRSWVGLTEEDFSAINQSCLTKLQAATSAESILKGKNNG